MMPMDKMLNCLSIQELLLNKTAPICSPLQIVHFMYTLYQQIICISQEFGDFEYCCKKDLWLFVQQEPYLTTYYCEDIETRINTPKFRDLFRKTGAYISNPALIKKV